MRPMVLLALAVFLPGFASAQETCNPSYQVEYGTCAHPSHPKEIKTVNTGWILVNKGARRISDALCQEYVQVVQRQNPSAQNITFTDIKDEENILRGIGKRDVYCKFSMDVSVPSTMSSPACGIVGVTRNCFEGVSADFVRLCLNAQPQTIEEMWRKAGCMVDSFKNAPQVQGMTQADYQNLTFQLDMWKNSFSVSDDPSKRDLASWLLQETAPR